MARPYSPARSHQIKLWAKRMKRFREHKVLLTKLLLDHGYNKETTLAWMRSPIPALKNRTPREMFNPYSIHLLFAYAKKHLPKLAQV